MILKSKMWLGISSATMLICLLIIVTIKPLWGIDFVGGSLLEVKGHSITASELEEVLVKDFNLPATIQTTADQSFLVRTTPLDPDQHTKLLAAIKAKDSQVTEQRFESIGPTIGAELRRKAAIATVFSIIVMICYLAYEFRHTGGLISPWKYGVSAGITLVHDLLFVTALFVLLGHFYGVPFDSLFVTAMLALFGYSVNDTIVLFNRLRQEWLATRSGNLLVIMDKAARATLIRSINTSMTTLLSLLMLFFFGGATIHWFIAALTASTIVGAYSTIFVAPAFLYAMSTRK